MPSSTPGPWHVIGDMIRSTVSNAAMRSVAKVYVSQMHGKPEAAANARLIASAPDLLAALKAVLDVGAADAAACEVTFGLCPETTHCPECDTRRAAIRMATTAIAKAEGRDRG